MLAGLLAASCDKPYTLNVDFALNRTDLRFKNEEAQSYFMVYSQSDWTVEFENEVSWATLGRTSGSGNGQVNVKCYSNPGVSRGVNVIVTNADGRWKTIYISQNAGMDVATYKPEDETIDLFAPALNPVIAIKTNLDEASVKLATVTVSCDGYDTPWIKNVTASYDKVTFEVDAFQEAGRRTGTILISFPSAKWDENQCRCAITVNQTDALPRISLLPSYALDPAGDLHADVEVETNWNPKYYSYTIENSFSDGSWIADVVYDGGRVFSIKPLINDGTEPRTTSMTCCVKDGDSYVMKDGALISATTTLTQAVAEKPLTPVYLTEEGGYANSFLIESTDTTLYCVDLKMVDGTAIENANSSRVLWQTVDGLIGATFVKDGKLFFTQSTGKTGNALIGVIDSSSKVIWSFHVWITDIHVNTFKFGGFVFMDRNLGALASTAPSGSESPTAGMHYEWGRKDPFPPVDGYSPTGNRNHMDIFPSDAVSFQIAQDGKPLSFTLENPTVYLWGSAGSGKEDWIDVADADLWGDKSGRKSNYDPCPYGWEVPSMTQMNAVLAKVKAAGSIEHYGLTLMDDDDNAAYFPCPGYYRRTTNTSSQMCNVGTFGWYWTRSTGTYNNAYTAGCRLQVHNTAGNRTIVAQPNRWGANVRCVKQN